MARQIRAEKAGMLPEPSVADLVQLTGLSTSTINRIIGPDPRDIHVTAIARFAAIFQISPSELISRAIARAGGMDVLLAEMPMSAAEDKNESTDHEASYRKRDVAMAAELKTAESESDEDFN